MLMAPHRKRVLYVEDERDIAECISGLLRLEGYEVTSVVTAEEALAELERGRHDVLLTDYRLPGRHGGWLLARAIDAGLIARERALMLTAEPKLDGVEGHTVLRKPVDLDVLIAALEAAIDGAAGEPAPTPARVDLALTLYITGSSVRSQRALRRLQRRLAAFDSAHVKLTVCDVEQGDDCIQSLEDDRVVVTPTLIRKHPRPTITLVGDLAAPALDELLDRAVEIEHAMAPRA